MTILIQYLKLRFPQTFESFSKAVFQREEVLEMLNIQKSNKVQLRGNKLFVEFDVKSELNQQTQTIELPKRLSQMEKLK